MARTLETQRQPTFQRGKDCVPLSPDASEQSLDRYLDNKEPLAVTSLDDFRVGEAVTLSGKHLNPACDIFALAPYLNAAPCVMLPFFRPIADPFHSATMS